MWELLTSPVRALGAFFSISAVGALGYIIGVIGCVLVPGVVFALRAVKTPRPIAWPLAVVAGTMLGGLILSLFGLSGGGVGGAGGGFANDIPTHDLALVRLNACPAAVAALDTPIRRTGVGHGTYHANGGFGTSTWELEVAGPTKTATVIYAAEMHGGTWALTALNLRQAGRAESLASCLHATATSPAPPRGSGAVHITRDDVIGLWGTPNDRQLLLTRFDADGHFTSGLFVDERRTVRIRGTWEAGDGMLTWHYDRAHSDAPQGFWDQLAGRIESDPSPVVELSKVRMVLQEPSGQLTEMTPMDPVRLRSLVEQLDR